MTILTKSFSSTSLGTGTTKTPLGGADMDLPKWAKTLLGVEVSLYPLTPKTQISYNAKFFLESDDIRNINPFIGLFPPCSANINTNTDSIIPKKELFVVNAPLSGGEKLKAYGQMLLADATANVYADMQVILGSAGARLPTWIDHLPGRQRYAQVGTWTAGVAAGKATGTAFSVVGGKNLVEVMSIVNTITTTASKPASGVFEYTSPGFAATPLQWIAQPVGSFIGTGKPNLAGLTRVSYLDVGIDSPSVMTDSLTMPVGLATDYWITGLVYI